MPAGLFDPRTASPAHDPRRFKILGLYKHDLSVSSFEQGSVFSEGYGADLALDFHRWGLVCVIGRDALFKRPDWTQHVMAWACGQVHRESTRGL